MSASQIPGAVRGQDSNTNKMAAVVVESEDKNSANTLTINTNSPGSNDGSEPHRKKSALRSPERCQLEQQARSAKKKGKGKDRRGISFADAHGQPLAEVHEIERRSPQRASANTGCCIIG